MVGERVSFETLFDSACPLALRTLSVLCSVRYVRPERSGCVKQLINLDHSGSPVSSVAVYRHRQVGNLRRPF